MNNKNFDSIVKSRTELITKTLATKGDEYASVIDRLHNFKSAGRIGDCTPEQALKGMMLKHLVSVFDIINNLVIHSIPTPTRECINEKVGDSINYLILLEALLKERLINDEHNNKR